MINLLVSVANVLSVWPILILLMNYADEALQQGVLITKTTILWIGIS